MPKILAIDDKKDNLITLSALLKNLMPDCPVITAQSGMSGIEKAKIEQPDVILLDIRMPDMDGFETCRRLKAHEQTGHIPIILITAIKTDSKSRTKGLDLGADAFLSKPIDEAELVSQVKVALRIKQAEDTLRQERDSLEQIVTERTAALQESEKKFRSIFEHMASGCCLDEIIYQDSRPVDYRIIDVNSAYQEITGIDRHAATGALASKLYGIEKPLFLDTFAQVAETGISNSFEAYFAPIGKHLHLTVSCPGPGRFSTVFSDITERRRAEEEREKLHAQLTQAQRMEAVGRLAGGVAHDFNNMLNVILGYAELARENIQPADTIYENLKEIISAAERSSDITRQLLAFARKQTVAPRVLDLNETVEGMLKMLRRLIGEDIDLSWKPGSRLGAVKMDPSQIDQVLANLCVNARDAISGVGRLTIETVNVRFDSAYCADHAGFVPGEYVLLAVSDNGCGMDKTVLENLFEPFFTTKEVGQGTGLGLATVYGIVKQNEGFINVYSEPGQGTTFRIYLPRHAEKSVDPPKTHQKKIAAGHGETILVVEDETSVLKLAQMILNGLGYTVLAAHTPAEAERLAEAHGGRIHLLITDVIMPAMNGRDLAGRLHARYPEIKTLFMSGYTADVIAHHGVLNAGVHFIQKPFSRQELAARVQEALYG